jgi:hypothetical protein
VKVSGGFEMKGEGNKINLKRNASVEVGKKGERRQEESRTKVKETVVVWEVGSLYTAAKVDRAEN